MSIHNKEISWSVTIVIIFNNPTLYLRECIDNCLQLDYDNFEVILVSSSPFSYTHPKVKVLTTTKLSPAIKRNIAIAASVGDLIAFIDDDAYPTRYWLKNAVRYFRNPELAALGGPGITSPADRLSQKISGLIYSSVLASGNYIYRHLPKKERFVDDYPTFNLIVRKSVLNSIGGFKSDFWPGEDTLLCLSIVKDLKMKILYTPDVLVYHHRRFMFKGHLWQAANYALHRGYFVKRFPQNSLKLAYFVPSIFVLSLFFGGILAFFLPGFRLSYLLFITSYLAISCSLVIFENHRNCLLIPAVISGIILTHITYGIFFLKGLFSKKLKEE